MTREIVKLAEIAANVSTIADSAVIPYNSSATFYDRLLQTRTSLQELRRVNRLFYIVIKGKGFLYSLPSAGPGADPGVQAVKKAISWYETLLLFVLAFYNGWEDRKTYTNPETLDIPSTSYKTFVNFDAVNH